MRISQTLYVAASSAALIGVVSGCGDQTAAPTGDQAVVIEKQAITKEQVEKKKLVLIGQQQLGRRDAVPVPDPPKYTKCIEALRGQVARASASDAGQASTGQLRELCKQQDEALRNQATSALIRSQWIVTQAKDLGVSVTDQQARDELKMVVDSAYPSQGEYQAYLKRTGLTEADMLASQREAILQRKIAEKLVEETGDPSNAEIDAYVEKNRAKLGEPERREVSAVITSSRTKAEEVLSALETGATFADVNQRYGLALFKTTNGRLGAVSENSGDKALDAAIFKAQPKTLVGPVKIRQGWIVLRVTRVSPAPKVDAAALRQQAKGILRAQAQQEVSNKELRSLEERMRKKTQCASGYVVAECSNYKPSLSRNPGAPAPSQPNENQ